MTIALSTRVRMVAVADSSFQTVSVPEMNWKCVCASGGFASSETVLCQSLVPRTCTHVSRHGAYRVCEKIVRCDHANRPRGSILLSQRGPTGLAVKRCPPAPPERSGFVASAVGPGNLASTACAARARTLSTHRAAAADRSALAARLARQRSSGAAEMRQGGAVAISDGAHAGIRSGLLRHVGLLWRHFLLRRRAQYQRRFPALMRGRPRRLCCLLGSPTWTSSRLPWAAGSSWTSSPSPNRTTLLPTETR